MSFFLPDTFCPPVLHHDLSLIAPSVKPTCSEIQRFVALREGHWIGIEVVCNAHETYLQGSLPPSPTKGSANLA